MNTGLNSVTWGRPRVIRGEMLEEKLGMHAFSPSPPLTNPALRCPN